MAKPQKTEHCLKLWLKYKPEHARTPDGTVTIPKFFLPHQTGTRKGHYTRMMRHIAKRRDEGKIWQAKIYEHPGNIVLFQWKEKPEDPHELLDALASYPSDELDDAETLNVKQSWQTQKSSN